jgi:hypothetical protein
MTRTRRGKQVHQPTHRKMVTEWFEGTLADRLEPHGTIVILAHRWHEEDLSGHLIEKHPDRWQVIRLPALAEPVIRWAVPWARRCAPSDSTSTPSTPSGLK